MTTTPTDLTKVSFNAMPRTVIALESAAERAGINRTDTLNRAVQVYAFAIGLSWWRVIWMLASERATVRRFATEAAAARKGAP